MALLSLPGLAVASYLTYSHYADQPTVCSGIGNCELVQTSEYSTIVGIPVALMGLLYFLALAAVALARLLRAPLAMEWAAPAVFSLSLGGTAFVTYLTSIELFVLHAICIWCVSVAVMTVLSLGLAVWARAAEAQAAPTTAE
jgi:uncharacterized membrane protein